MVLGSFGLDIPESELRKLCDCTPLFGADALMAVDTARHLGFTGTTKYTLTTDELRRCVTAGYFPIVFVNLKPIDNISDIHALVVIEFSQEGVTVLDPLVGERVLPIETFSTAWELRHNLAILVEK